jgi:hypothetical protein
MASPWYKETWFYKKAYYLKSFLLRFFKFFRQDFNRFKMAAAYELRKKPCQQIFFILCQPRTGSNLFRSYLNSIPGIICEGEILSQHNRYGLSYSHRKEATLRHIQHTLNYRHSPIRGAKICFYQLDGHGLSLPEFVAAFPSARWFSLYRENILLQYLSQQIGYKSNKWVRVDASDPLSLTQIQFDPKDALEYRNQTLSRCKEILEIPELKKRVIWISYEELAKNAQGIFDRKILPVFNLPSSPVKTRYHKQNPFAISEIIENYSEVKEMIEQTDFQHHYE